jgi:AcrR family transcriptional regulator
LADIGPSATIDQVSEVAGLSVSTIYQHFDSKELLFQSAIGLAMIEWQEWVDEYLEEDLDPLEERIIPARLFLRLKESHPLYARMAARNLNAIALFIPEISGGFSKHVRELAKANVIKIDNLDIRIQSFSAAIFAALSNQLLNPKSKIVDADIAIEVGLALLGISPAKAKKLAHGKLPQISIVIQ